MNRNNILDSLANKHLIYSDEMSEIMEDTSKHIEKKENPVLEIRETLERHVREFEAELNSQQEVMVMAASFGSQLTFCGLN